MFKRIILKTLLVLVFIVAMAGSTGIADAYVSVKGYYRSDGTYVRPHVRSNPNGLKYDNYGYKPSQGLYNDTYGTRGASWDTPTYITDSDYYVGKALYESGGSGGTAGTTYLNSSNYRYLKKGLSNSGIKELQTTLSKDKAIYPEGITSGYFGPLTERAVQRFQIKYGIVSYGTPSTTGYGNVGPKTLKKINEIFSGGIQQASVITTKKQNSYTNTSVNLPANASLNYLGSGWDCNRGYYKSSGQCSKVQIPANASLNYLGSGWDCNRGYYKVSGRCQFK